MLNTVIGDFYRIERQLGQDQFGNVYFGRDIRFPLEEQPVAIRILNPKLTGLPGFKERFTEIAPRLQTWDQLYINRILDQGVATIQEEELYYLISETPGKEALGDYIQRERKNLDPEKIARLFDQIAAAFEFAHRNNIFHGNLNLWNITMKQTDETAIPEIADFGLVQMLTPYSLTELEQLLEWKIPIGVPEFIAPERFSGNAPAKSNDLYVLGVILYYIISGNLPFTGNFEQLMLAHSYRQPPTFGPQVRNSTQLHQMLLRPLSKIPADRISIPEIIIRYRQIMGLPRTMLPIFDTHPPRKVPPTVEPEPPKKKSGWFGLKK